MKTSGNTILITGGASGIGRELAERFQAQGNTVIIAGRRRDRLDAVTEANPGMVGYVLDVEDKAGIDAFAATVIAAHPDLNVLINNAGIMLFEDLTRSRDLADAEGMVTTNLLGPIRAHQRADRPSFSSTGRCGHQRLVGPRLRAAGLDPDLFGDEGGDPFLHGQPAGRP